MITLSTASEDAGDEIRLAPWGRRPRFSPDGTRVAYWVGQFGGLPRGTIHLVSAQGGQTTQLQPGFAYAMHPVWSPNGDGLLYFGSRERDPTAPPEAGEDWWLTPLDEGAAVKTGALEAFRRAGIRGRPRPSRWSADGDLVYFLSEKDGFRCIWARRLHPVTREPIGASFEVYASHSARRSLLNLGIAVAGISVASDRIVFNLGELTGNVSIATIREQ